MGKLAPEQMNIDAAPVPLLPVPVLALASSVAGAASSSTDGRSRAVP